LDKGKPLSKEEMEQIISEFHQLQQRGISQKIACDKISEKYGRGYWSILNLIGNSKTTKQAATDFT